jgi:hypothetical protein
VPSPRHYAPLVRAPKPKVIAGWLWHGLNAASLAQWLWSVGGGGLATTLLSTRLQLPAPWSIVLALSVFLLVAAAILTFLTHRRRTSRGATTQTTARSWTGQPPVPAPPPQVGPSTGPAKGGDAKTRSEGGELSRLLQRRLDQAVALRKNIPAFPGMVSPLHPTTTQADVETWARRTSVALESTPKLLAEFNYRPPRAPLAGLLATNPAEPAYKKSLDQKIANLGEIITLLREQGR